MQEGHPRSRILLHCRGATASVNILHIGLPESQDTRILGTRPVLVSKKIPHVAPEIPALARRRMDTEKNVVAMLKGLKAAKKTLIITAESNEQIYKSARNIEGVKVATVNTLCVYDILNCSLEMPRKCFLV